MLYKNFSDCERIILKGTKDTTISVEVIEMLRPSDGVPLSYNVACFIVPAGCRTDYYTLKTISETIFVRTGMAEVEVDGKRMPLDATQVIHIPAGCKRCIFNVGSSTLQYHSIAEPVYDPMDAIVDDEVQVTIIPSSSPKRVQA